MKLTWDALIGFARNAIGRGIGARGLRSVLEALLRRTMFDLPSIPEIAKWRIYRDGVLGESKIRLEQRLESEDEPERSVG